MKLSKYIPKLNESTKKRKHNYIGNCTDVDKQSNKRVCDLFPDATTMASVIGYDSMDETHENLTEISKNEFLQYVDETVIPKKALRGTAEYFFLDMDDMGIKMRINESALFVLYNVTQDIHYFFFSN
jgi:hypothetical protein